MKDAPKDALQRMLAEFREGQAGSWSSRADEHYERLDGASARPGAEEGETVHAAPVLRPVTLPEAAKHAVSDATTAQDRFKIRIAKRSVRKDDSLVLVGQRYSHRGYRVPQLKQDPNLLTLGAYWDGTLVGTVAVRLDSPNGLSADELYKSELDVLRQGGLHLCEFTRLATDESSARMHVLAGLFHTAYLYGSVIHGCTHAVIEVTPQHAAFYRRALRFEQIGSERLNPRVNTHGVLMCVAFAATAEGLARYAGKPDAPGARRSLFLYGFPPNEEAGVLNRLRERVERE